MSNIQKIWLVEIRVKDWRPDLKKGGRVVTYEEVIAIDDIAARHAGFEQFESRCKYEPVMKRIMKVEELLITDCCAPAAVEVEQVMIS